MLTFIKLGGSLITDKRQEYMFRADTAARIAAEIAQVRSQYPDHPLLIGHGSGSFGHVTAKRHDTVNGVKTADQWIGFAEVAFAASQLNHLMTAALREAGLPVFRVQPSASLNASAGTITQMAVEPIRQSIAHGLVPLVYGDVAFDEQRGGTIASTETVFIYLAQHMPVSRILMLGEVDGVYDVQGHVIPLITPQNITEIEAALGGSEGADVTGGMKSKVHDMLALAQNIPGVRIQIINGAVPGVLQQVFAAGEQPGTVITA